MHFCTCAECGTKKTKFVKNKKGSGFVDKLIDKGLKSGVAGSPWHVDFKKGFKLLKDSFKSNNVSEEEAKAMVKRYKEEYKKAKQNGYKGSYTKFAREKGWTKKSDFTFPGF